MSGYEEKKREEERRRERYEEKGVQWRKGGRERDREREREKLKVLTNKKFSRWHSFEMAICLFRSTRAGSVLVCGLFDLCEAFGDQ